MKDGERHTGTAPAAASGAPADAEGTTGEGSPDAVAAPAGCGVVVLSRIPDGYRDAFCRYAVLVDDVRVGGIRRGERLRFEVPPGEHRLQLRIDWCSSPPVTVLVEPGETVDFVCSPGGDASEGLAVGAGRDRYITLRRTSEPAVLDKSPVDRGTRLLLGAALGFLGGGVTLLGAFVWQATGAARGAANVVVVVSLAVTVGSMAVFRLARRRRDRPGRLG